RLRQAFERTAAGGVRIRAGRGAPCRCGIFLRNRVHGRIEALEGGTNRTEEVQRGKSPAKRRRVQISGGIEQIQRGWLARNGLAI
ncbi:MAG: hypothetical protein ACREDJ_03575, partial [Methylocella sp.]